MTKKHFIELANLIREHNRVASHPANQNTMQKFTEDQLDTLARFCQLQNSQFMRGRWMSYIAGECGPNGGAR